MRRRHFACLLGRFDCGSVVLLHLLLGLFLLLLGRLELRPPLLQPLLGPGHCGRQCARAAQPLHLALLDLGIELDELIVVDLLTRVGVRLLERSLEVLRLRRRRLAVRLADGEHDLAELGFWQLRDLVLGLVLLGLGVRLGCGLLLVGLGLCGLDGGGDRGLVQLVEFHVPEGLEGRHLRWSEHALHELLRLPVVACDLREVLLVLLDRLLRRLLRTSPRLESLLARLLRLLEHARAAQPIHFALLHLGEKLLELFVVNGLGVVLISLHERSIEVLGLGRGL
mmetsp:Transcript_20210/g.42597  ORF Transcript_20210/g.42597 Transcript_20210/m.42597 type:complete len:282 (-) Transcript_20210:1144-1989(-)